MPLRQELNGPARMEDVARRARVSMITVSRALYKPHKVAEVTRARVLEAVRDLRYVPNLVAGSLASRRTRIIAAVVPTIRNPVFNQAIYGISEVLRGHGYHLLLGGSGYSLTEEESLVATFLARRPDAIFLHGTRHTAETRRLLLNAGIPIVETGNLAEQSLDMVVSYSNFDAGKAMTVYLLGKGYRKVAFVSAPVREHERAAARRRGYRAALRARGVPYDAKLVIETSLGLRQGAEALVEILRREPKADAVFFAGDILAVGALLECQRQGWSVPKRVAIAGFDDQEMAAEAIPPLTTVRVPGEDIGRRATQMLLDRLQGKPVDPNRVDMGFTIVERNST